MRILLYYPPWANRWIPYIEKELSCYDLTVSSANNREDLLEVSKDQDVLLSMWANEVLWFWTHIFPEKKIISYLRRYEIFYSRAFDKIDWAKINDLIFVNTYLQKLFTKKIPDTPIKTHLIYNGVDLTEFNLNTSGRTGKKIAMVCSMQPTKNMYMAIQILLALPSEYKIYHIGKTSKINLPEFKFYLENLGLKDRFIIEEKKEPSEVPSWLAGKDFILSTSVSEGNPMNVLEGMAMGLKPIVHRWPGAEDQFPESCLFDTVRAAINSILSRWSDKPTSYRSIVDDSYNVTNYKKLHDIINSNIT